MDVILFIYVFVNVYKYDCYAYVHTYTTMCVHKLVYSTYMSRPFLCYVQYIHMHENVCYVCIHKHEYVQYIEGIPFL